MLFLTSTRFDTYYIDIMLYVLAIARRSLKDTLVTIVSLNHVTASCGVGVWIDYISVVLTTVWKSVTPDPKANKQANAGKHSINVFLHVLWGCTAVRSMRRIPRLKLFIGRAWRSTYTYVQL